MRRSLFVGGAVLCAVIAVVMATDLVNFETDRIDRWIMIFSIAGVVFFLALAGADNDSSDEPTTGRAAAARAMGEGRVDPSTLPSKPGSLLKQQRAAAEATEPPAMPVVASAPEIGLDLTDPAEPLVMASADEPTTEPTDDDVPVETDVVEAAAEPEAAGIEAVEAAAAELEAVEPQAAESVEPSELETIESMDDQQIEEITALVDEAEIDLAAEETAVEPAAAEPMARLELRLADYDDDDLQRVVKESEAVVIAEMVRSGQLSSEGELTERDIASMVFLAHTSSEMLAELRLRKAMVDGAETPAGLENADR